jgi:hypothetical protein
MSATIPPPLDAAQNQPGCWSKHWKKIIGCGCLTLLAGMTLIAVLIYFSLGMLKGSEAYKASFDSVQHSNELADRLGTPITAGHTVSGNANTSGASGQAAIHYSISGPKGKGDVDVEGEKHAGIWHWTLMQVRLSDGTIINLIEEPMPPPDQGDQPPPEPPVESSPR